MTEDGTVNLEPFVNALKTYGMVLLAIFYTKPSTTELVGHAVVAYGTPKIQGNYYHIRVYDPNRAAEQTYKVSTDYSSYYVLGDDNVDVKYFCYYADFYSIRSIDLDGDYNVYGDSASTYALDLTDIENNSADPNDRLTGQTWIAVEAKGECCITNDSGDRLLCNLGVPSGDMEILNQKIVSNGDNSPATVYFQVPYSATFTYVSASGEAKVSVLWEKKFQRLSGSGIECAIFAPDAIELFGNSMTYEVCAWVNSERKLIITGSSANQCSLDFLNGECEAISDAEYEVNLCSLSDRTDSYLSESVNADEICLIDVMGASADFITLSTGEER